MAEHKYLTLPLFYFDCGFWEAFIPPYATPYPVRPNLRGGQARQRAGGSLSPRTGPKGSRLTLVLGRHFILPLNNKNLTTSETPEMSTEPNRRLGFKGT